MVFFVKFSRPSQISGNNYLICRVTFDWEMSFTKLGHIVNFPYWCTSGVEKEDSLYDTVEIRCLE